MRFLFHTVIEFGGSLVNYNIFQQDGDLNFAPLQGNSYRVKEASDFWFEQRVVSSDPMMPERAQTLLQEARAEWKRRQR